MMNLVHNYAAVCDSARVGPHVRLSPWAHFCSLCDEARATPRDWYERVKVSADNNDSEKVHARRPEIKHGAAVPWKTALKWTFLVCLTSLCRCFFVAAECLPFLLRPRTYVAKGLNSERLEWAKQTKSSASAQASGKLWSLVTSLKSFNLNNQYLFYFLNSFYIVLKVSTVKISKPYNTVQLEQNLNEK